MANKYDDIQFWRQLAIFSPEKFKKSITVIGAGATGSYITWLLAKMGCRDITVYDFDKIEAHNLPNQTYGLGTVGDLKVEALKTFILANAGVEIKAIPERFEKQKVKGIVFVLTDTMKSRKEIWLNSIKYKPFVDLLIETRMAAEWGTIYAIRPIPHADKYEKTLYEDKDAEESACTNRAIASTVAVIAGLAVKTMTNFATGKSFDHEVIVLMGDKFGIITKNFDIVQKPRSGSTK